MNHKQKLGYMALGALILAIGITIGITIGQFITPNIEAQQNGVFDEITCRQLTVVDENGEVVIALGSIKHWGNGIAIYDSNGKMAFRLYSDKSGNHIRISNPFGETAFTLNSWRSNI